MKRLMLTLVLFSSMFNGAAAQAVDEQWIGVDETVVEHFAERAGQEVRDPFINTDKGDLLLFCFALAGAAGGFVAGFFYRDLFGRRKTSGTRAQNV